jgi:hypothetical protein
LDAVNTVVSGIELRVDDIGDFKDIPIIELLVKPGDLVALNDSFASSCSRRGGGGPLSGTASQTPGRFPARDALVSRIEQTYAKGDRCEETDW